MNDSIWIDKQSNVYNLAIANLRLEKSYRCPFRRITSGSLHQRSYGGYEIRPHPGKFDFESGVGGEPDSQFVAY